MTVVAISVQVVHVESYLADALVLVGQDGVCLASKTVVVVWCVTSGTARITSRAYVSVEVEAIVTSAEAVVQGRIIDTTQASI